MPEQGNPLWRGFRTRSEQMPPGTRVKIAPDGAAVSAEPGDMAVGLTVSNSAGGSAIVQLERPPVTVALAKPVPGGALLYKAQAGKWSDVPAQAVDPAEFVALEPGEITVNSSSGHGKITITNRSVLAMPLQPGQPSIADTGTDNAAKSRTSASTVSIPTSVSIATPQPAPSANKKEIHNMSATHTSGASRFKTSNDPVGEMHRRAKALAAERGIDMRAARSEVLRRDSELHADIILAGNPNLSREQASAFIGNR